MELRSGSLSSIDNVVLRSSKSKKSVTMAGDSSKGQVHYSNNDLMEAILKNGQVIAGMKEDINALQADVNKIKQDHGDISRQVHDVDARVNSLELEVNKDDGLKSKLNVTMAALRSTQISAINAEYHSMQYNVIAHNKEIRLTNGGTRETQSSSVDCAYEIIENCFGITDARDTIPLSIAHRLPSKKERRPPLIFKLLHLSDKQRLWSNISKVNDYNKSKRPDEKINIQMIQLPAKLARDKQSLQDDFEAARIAGSKPKWRFAKSSGQYCYVINDAYYKPHVDYFLNKYISRSKND